MRITFSEVAEARANPTAYKARKERKESARIPPYPHKYVELAIHGMHKHRRSAIEARADLKARLESKFPGNPKLNEAVGDFDIYVDAYGRRGDTYVTGWLNVSVPLPAAYGPDFSAGGRVMRVDLTDDGYAAWVFARRSADWTVDPRLPLMQAAVAAELGVDVEEVTAGVYCFEDGTHHAVPYDFDQVASEIAEFCKILDRLR